MITDFHVHTTFCDGKSSTQDILDAALSLKMDALGFSGHSYVEFDPDYSMSPDDTGRYFEEITMLKEKYAGKIKILCGIEQDYYSDMPTGRYDYVIGSVHYLKCGNEYASVDSDKKTLLSAKDRFFGGDIYSLIEEYYALVGDVAEKTGCNIVGHFDLVEKFNEDGSVFDRTNPRYVTAYKVAVDKLMERDVVFEVNTGAISRGYRTKPYPDFEILKYIKSCGGRVILSSDSHHADTLCFGFDNADETISTLGILKTENIL